MNKKKNIKFLILGASMLGIASLAPIGNAKTKITQESIQTKLQQVIQQEKEKGFFSETSEINVKIVSPKKTKTLNVFTQQEVETEELDFSENNNYRIGQICKMTLSFDENGNIPFLGKDKSLMEMTKLTTERQKEIARKYVVLHEHSHCEFSNIANPVIVKNTTPEFTEKVNYYLKEFEVSNLDWGNGSKELNYIKTLNESYADVSAMILLIKEYGLQDKDLNFFLKTIEVQRTDSYLQKGADSHNTQLAIHELFKVDNLKEIKNLNDKDSFQKFALKIANNGVQDLMSERKEFVENAFTKENFAFSIMINTVRLLKFKTATEEEKKQYQSTIWKEGIKPGMSYDIGQNILKGIDLNKYNFDSTKDIPGKIQEDPVDFIVKLMSNDKKTMNSLEGIYKQFKEVTADFKEDIYQENKGKIIDFGKDVSKEEIMQRVSDLRTQFVKDSQINQLNMK